MTIPQLLKDVVILPCSVSLVFNLAVDGHANRVTCQQFVKKSHFENESHIWRRNTSGHAKARSFFTPFATCSFPNIVREHGLYKKWH